MQLSLPDKIVMRASAPIAPIKTVSLGCLIAIIAAIKNVLSPISETTITDNDATNAWTKPIFSVGDVLLDKSSCS